MSDYEQGFASGQRWARSVRTKMDYAVDPSSGEGVDLLAHAVEAGELPPDLVDQIEERVPVEAQAEFWRGFWEAVRAFLAGQHVGMGDN